MIPDLLIVGGGIVGLSLADCALRAGLRVTLLDKSACATEASWAGAGMLTHRPWPRRGDGIDYGDLTELSVNLHATWATRLKEETGIDPCYRRSGALEIFTSPDDGARAKELIAGCNSRGVRAALIPGADARKLEPGLAEHISGAIHFPHEAQIRNPRLLRALLASIKKQAVTLHEHCDVADIDIDSEKSVARGVVLRSGERLAAGAVAVCVGAWGAQLPALVAAAPVVAKIHPVRGQILCYQAAPELASRLITQDRHYIVPRGDGVLLLGATHENAGFEKATTAAGLAELQTFGHAILPALRKLTPIKHWAGLRPGLKGRHPIFGAVPHVGNLFLALGHYRNGLTLAPATAELLLAIILRKKPPFCVKNWAP
jgi:glycine oxidase